MLHLGGYLWNLKSSMVDLTLGLGLLVLTPNSSRTRSRSTSKCYDAGRRGKGNHLKLQYRAELARLHDKCVEPSSDRYIEIDDGMEHRLRL
jgi:hypothetical protein